MKKPPGSQREVAGCTAVYRGPLVFVMTLLKRNYDYCDFKEEKYYYPIVKGFIIVILKKKSIM